MASVWFVIFNIGTPWSVNKVNKPTVINIYQSGAVRHYMQYYTYYKLPAATRVVAIVWPNAFNKLTVNNNNNINYYAYK